MAQDPRNYSKDHPRSVSVLDQQGSKKIETQACIHLSILKKNLCNVLGENGFTR